MKFEIIEDKEQLYDKCENIEELYDNFYYQLLVENQELKEKQNYDLNWAFKYDELHKENQELKLELSGYRQAILKDKEMLGLKEENDKLKKQLEDANEKIILLQASEPMLEWKKELEKNQQKEFIEWLEAMNIMYKNEYKDIDTAEHYNCVLQKYKSIIGDDK